MSVETNTARRLPDCQSNRVFEKFYESPSFVLVTTTNCPEEVLNKIVSSLESDGLSWLAPLKTGTSRKLFLGRLNCLDETIPDVIFKKSRHGDSPPDQSFSQPQSAVDEIKSNLLLNTILQKLVQSGGLYPPQDFDHLSVHLEKPLGILVEKQSRSKYSIFSYERGFDLGEVLQHTDPPISGAINYNLQNFKVFCGIKDVLDRITAVALREGLVMTDYNVHQVLYRADDATKSLEMMLIDSERFRRSNGK